MGARIHPNPMVATSLLVFFIFSLIFCSSAATTPENAAFARNLNPKVLGLKKQKQQLTYLHLYWHDIIGGSNPTSVQIVAPLANYSSMFGFVNMIDNPLTVGLELNSTLVGKAQGFYASASQHEFGFLMAMNFAFTHGKYNGSTITVFGRNPISETVREMPVIGGSGRFRFATGYAQARTRFVNATSLDAIVEYDIYVLHY